MSSSSRILCLLLLGQIHLVAEEPPVPLPPLQHYAALWERSIFTTKDLPSPDAPAGPLFTDSLSLAGTYELDGQFVAILVDRSTSQFTEARIGRENEQGIKIRKVQPGATPDKTRVQLQKGDVAGWVSQAETPAAEPAPEPQVRAAQPAHAPAATPLLPPPAAPPPLPAPAIPTAAQDVPLPPP
ncbi:MAG: hypothetical protein LDL31_05045 [Prosthecobacter sp.]|nr:hypothetical protein [Prosthecobacter sp.]